MNRDVLCLNMKMAAERSGTCKAKKTAVDSKGQENAGANLTAFFCTSRAMAAGTPSWISMSFSSRPPILSCDKIQLNRKVDHFYLYRASSCGEAFQEVDPISV